MLTALAALASCQGSSNPGQQTASELDSNAMPYIEFDTAVFNFGRILQGEQVTYKFHFVNTGKADLVIKKVETSCGCTVPEYDRTPVKPGGEGCIKVRFDSDGKDGTQYKTVKVITNCKDDIFDLVVTGTVEVR